ncbi:radical SAM protein [Candidatus Bathyarchaeota archaeon]|nr:radical SAM protein [Candidatus Bathyarchaeota archaeon]
MDVILINPPHSFMQAHRGGKKGKKELLSYPPLGLLYLAAVLEKNHITVKVIDCPANGTNEIDLIEIVEKEKPSIIGITATTPQTQSAVNLSKILKTKFGNNIFIGLGGAHISADPDFIKRFSFFDFGLTGEGDQTFLDIVKQILADKKVSGVYRGEALANLDTIPFPARHLIDNSLYFMPINAKRFTSIITSRGCPYDCLYCSRPVIGKNIRYRSSDMVVAEMTECVEKYGIEWFQFVDDTLTLKRDHILSICKKMIDQKLDVEWGCQTRIDLVDESILRIMHDAGCREISFGVESGSDRIRSVLRKHFDDNSVFSAFKLCRKVGIETTAFLLLGLPTETKEDMNKTINFGKKIDADYIEVHVSTPFPGSDLFTIAIEDGIIPADIWDKYTQGELGSTLPLFIQKYLTREELLEAQKQAYKNFYFRSSYILKRLSRDITSAQKLKRDVAVMRTLRGSN